MDVMFTGSSKQTMRVVSGFPWLVYEEVLRVPQMYGCNVLNLGSSRIISVNPSSARQIVNDPHFKGDVQVIDFSPITSMYGAVHCSSQVCYLGSVCSLASYYSCACWLILAFMSMLY